jgi:hypothetical protein
MKVSVLLLAAALLALPTFGHADESLTDELPIVGFDKNHCQTDALLPKTHYKHLFRKIVTDMHDSAKPVLERQKKRPGWMLRHVAVGVGVSATVGLGPIYSLTAKPRIRMVFSNSTHPEHP